MKHLKFLGLVFALGVLSFYGAAAKNIKQKHMDQVKTFIKEPEGFVTGQYKSFKERRHKQKNLEEGKRTAKKNFKPTKDMSKRERASQKVKRFERESLAARDFGTKKQQARAQAKIDEAKKDEEKLKKLEERDKEELDALDALNLSKNATRKEVTKAFEAQRQVIDDEFKAFKNQVKKSKDDGRDIMLIRKDMNTYKKRQKKETDELDKFERILLNRVQRIERENRDKAFKAAHYSLVGAGGTAGYAAILGAAGAGAVVGGALLLEEDEDAQDEAAEQEEVQDELIEVSLE